MAETITVRTRFQHRRGLAEQWKALNPVLLDGEWGYEKDTLLFKVGDGVTAWNALPYAGYILPVASASVLGGVTAAAKGSGDTVEVKIDAASRRLFVPTYPSVPALSDVALTGCYADLVGTPDLAPVATSGSYDDLEGKPSIPENYTLPAAAADRLGGVVAATRGDGDTVEVKIDATTHRLYVPTFPADGSLDLGIEEVTMGATVDLSGRFTKAGQTITFFCLTHGTGQAMSFRAGGPLFVMNGPPTNTVADSLVMACAFCFRVQGPPFVAVNWAEYLIP